MIKIETRAEREKREHGTELEYECFSEVKYVLHTRRCLNRPKIPCCVCGEPYIYSVEMKLPYRKNDEFREKKGYTFYLCKEHAREHLLVTDINELNNVS